MRPRFALGIRVQLGLAALALLAIPWLAAQFIVRMETFLRGQQETAIGATARAIASALSNRPALFPRTAVNDPEAEEYRRIVGLFGATDTNAAADLGKAYVPSDEIEGLLKVMGRSSSRVYVIDSHSLVRGLSGSIAESEPAARSWFSSWMRPLAALVIPRPKVPVGDVSLPDRTQIDKALNGLVSTSWRRTVKNPDRVVLSAAQPIFLGDEIVGAVLVQETTDSIALFRESELERLLFFMLVVTGAALAILLFFASRLATRVSRLHRQAEAAIDRQGRITGSIAPTDSGDEIGDLTRTISAVMERLRGYNAYLETMAGRLSHELRTPVAVVRSSLDNLKTQKLPEETRVYVERAGEGVERLSRLISRLSEGTRLEQLLESAERERFDLAAVVAGCVEGYRLAHPDRRFELAGTESPLILFGIPDAFAQLLDKLVENAIDFAPPESAIRVSLDRNGYNAVLSVENDGPPLPEDRVAGLFDSMVTLRDPREGGANGHLGLGLFIVRLVAEFHRGKARAANLEGGRGVRFEVEVPAPAQNP